MNEMSETIAEVLRLDELSEDLSPAPWHMSGVDSQHVQDDAGEATADAYCSNDAALIAYYRTAAPALAREVQRLQAEVDVLEGRAWVCQGPDCYAIHPMTTAPVLGEYPEDGDVFCSLACLDAYNLLGDEVIE